MENWKAVPGFEGLYEVSDRGRVRSLDRTIMKRVVRNGPLIQTKRRGKVLSVCLDTHGYPMVGLCEDGARQTALVHQLVLNAFVGPKRDGEECRHLNGVRADNRLGNLAWGTPVENTADKVRHGTIRAPRGSDHGLSTLSEDAVRDIRFRAASGEATGSISSLHGVSAAHVRRIVRRQAWGWLDERTHSALLAVEPARRAD